MKKLIKLLSMIMAYLIIISIPIGFNIVNAQEISIKKYLYYSTLDNIVQVVQYKDKALTFTFTDNTDYNYNYNYNYNYSLEPQSYFDLYSLKNNNKEKVYSNIPGYSIYYINRENNLLHFKASNPSLEYDTEFFYNFDDSTTGYYCIEDAKVRTNEIKENCIKKINAKYNYNYDNNTVDSFSFEEKYDLNGNKYTNFVFMPEKNNSDYYFTGIYNNAFQYISNHPLSISFDNKNRLIITEYCDNVINLLIVNDNKINKISIDGRMFGRIFVVDDHIYIANYDNEFNSYTYKNGQITLDKKYTEDIINFSTDKDGNLWILKDVNGRRIVCKLENNEFKEKYEVDGDMYRLSVYDDNNMTAYSYNKFTTINATENNGSETTNTTNTGNTTTNNDKNNSKRLTQTGSPINTKTLLIFASILTTIGSGVFIKRRF
ncbi:hypothetical protein CM240_0247 [Clostridium bornimense]|uniref:Uncharacterized protein n=1 Tax=Clostridium bornimense TaxID=1216932 RepID=W6RZI5_9CLOT|nr:hypothetical protein [Clostridium bornimense]CDM67417.1 hypothetical protein CM240_0247 [Clostridium bornimense]